jgi:hypothetical protein
VQRERVVLGPGWRLWVDEVEHGPGDVVEVSGDLAEHLVSRGRATIHKACGVNVTAVCLMRPGSGAKTGS